MTDNNTHLFINATIHTASGIWPNSWLLVQAGRIVAIGTDAAPTVGAPVTDLAGEYLIPGLIDMHVHGALGHDTMRVSADGLGEMARFFARHGVTSFLASTITASGDEIEAALGAVEQAMRQPNGGANLLGAHLEGPYIEEGRRGAHDAAQVRLAQPAEYLAYLDSGLIKMVTVAPDFSENLTFIRAAAERGIIAAIGHGQATYQQAREAVNLGATQVTHCFNAMNPLHHRQPGLLGAALALPALTCELIADLVHLDAVVLRLAYAAKGADRIVLVTDAVSGTGLADGDYDLWGTRISVRQGEARTASGALAGSTLTLEYGMQRMMQACDITLEQVLPMVTLNPARQLGLTHKGRIAVGCDADLAVWDGNQITLTMVGGKIVYDRSA
ncbi:MAG: N-acetylglucosamine-6-phosphate deacetylase [Chloroflexi bacterium]|nr:N-acetylglucosamine-6-phosphate deacetylase [Chloroflexota bacterium]